MAKDITAQSVSTYLTEEELAKQLLKEDAKFIEQVRYGEELDLTCLTAKQKRQFTQLKKRGLILRGFGLINPFLFKPKSDHQGHLHFLFISAKPEIYFAVKHWIFELKRTYNFSAYTTLGQFDFVVRIVASDHEMKEICSTLEADFGLKQEAGPGKTRTLLNIEVVKPVMYGRKYPRSQLNPDHLSPEDRRWLVSLNEEIDPNTVGQEHITRYTSLRRNHFLLGTRCLVKSPALDKVVTFILVAYQDEEDILRCFNDALGDTIIDLFMVDGCPPPYGALLVCEFNGYNSNALNHYNKWMDAFYDNVKLLCLTFPSDSTICEFPDVYESAASLRKCVAKYWSNVQGVRLGKAVWYGQELDDITPVMDREGLTHNTLIAGPQGSGKTNTCLHIAREIAGMVSKLSLLHLRARSPSRMRTSSGVEGRILG